MKKTEKLKKRKNEKKMAKNEKCPCDKKYSFGIIYHSTATTTMQSGEAPFSQARSLHTTLGIKDTTSHGAPTSEETSFVES